MSDYWIILNYTFVISIMYCLNGLHTTTDRFDMVVLLINAKIKRGLP